MRRHFLAYDRDGLILGEHTWLDVQPGASSGLDIDPRRPGSHPFAKAAHEQRSKEPGFKGFLELKCPCAPTDGTCQCASEHVGTCYVLDDKLTPKPVREVMLSGQPILDGSERTGSPGCLMKLVIRAKVPDGHQLTVKAGRSQGRIMREAEQVLVFKDGVSSELALRAPAQGMTGIVFGESLLIRRFTVSITGWE